MRLFAKLLVIVVALGATALGLLALRQQRYEVSNEISRTHNRIVEQERAQWRMRAQVAARSTPADIRKAADRQGIDLAPVQESVTEAEAAVGAKAESAAAPAVPATKAKAAAPAKPAAKGASRGR